MGLMSALRRWRERRSVMRELYAFRRKEREWDKFKIRDILVEAAAAAARDDQVRAAELWLEATTRNQNEAETSPLAISVLLGLRRYDEAERLMLRGQATNPSDPHYGLGLMQIANAKADYETAVDHAATMRRRFPTLTEGYSEGIAALRNAKRLNEADTLVELAMRRFPQEVLMFMEYARLAVERQDWEAGFERWNVVLKRFNHPSGYAGAANMLLKLEQYSAANEILEAGRLRYPSDGAIARVRSSYLQLRGDLS